MELRERLTGSYASQEDATCGGRSYQQLSGQATAAAQPRERRRARHLHPRKTALRLFCLLPVLVCLACALIAAVQGTKRSPPPPPLSPLSNPEYFKRFKPDIVETFSPYGSAQFDKEDGTFEGINLAGGSASAHALCQLLQILLINKWSLRKEFRGDGGNPDLKPKFSSFCVKDDEVLSSNIERGDTNGFVTNYCNDPPYMPPACLQTGGSVTVDVMDARGVLHHLHIVLHPAGEPPLDSRGRFFRTYIGRPSDRTAYLRAIMATKTPTVPAVLYAKRECIGNPYGAIDLSLAAACVANQLQASSAFNGAPPRAVALIAEVSKKGYNFLPHYGYPSSKICIERIPDATVPGFDNTLVPDEQSVFYQLYVLHPQPSSIPFGTPSP